MPTYRPINSSDTIMESTTVTKGLFTGNVGTLAGSSFTTSSLSSTQKNYYYTMQYSGEDQFSVTYGHKGGSGSDSVTNVVGETEAIYKQYATLLLGTDYTPDSPTNDGFQFTSGSTADDVFVVSFKRARMKDRLNRKNWTISLAGSGSETYSGSGRQTILHLTDDSETVEGVQTPVGMRYNVVSGALGTVSVPASTTKYGWFYPSMGMVVLDTYTLSGSGNLGGASGTVDPSYLATSTSNLKPNLTNDGTADNAFKLVTALQRGDATSFRNEEDQTTVSYFCRAFAQDFNFSTNPTFVSGALSEFQQETFEGNPKTYITTVGLYDNQQNLMAVGRLSSPVEKSYQTEATIKVNLTY